MEQTVMLYMYENTQMYLIYVLFFKRLHFEKDMVF